jgi:hypothetical protein
MRPVALRRLKALILTAVLLVGGSGASALDLAIYHLGEAPAESARHRIAGTDAPRPHGDACVLLDWTARGPYTVSLPPAPLRADASETSLSQHTHAAAPRPADLFAAPRPRAPPVQLA